MTDPNIDASDMARKVRALLDKAEASEFTFEREAFTAKAMALMAQYQISDAMIASATPHPERRGTIIETKVNLGSGAYVRARLALIDSVAGANNCLIVTTVGWDGRDAFVNGFDRDVERVELLYTSLLVQATTEMNRLMTPKGAIAVRVRRSFLFGFASSVGRRLADTISNATAAYETETGATGVALVLLDRKHEVDDAVLQRHGRLRPLNRSSTSIDTSAAKAGRAAGERADISGGRSIGATRGSIGGGV